ncbi:MAG TPA: Reeler domain-containing protein, partial [Xanthomonadales bacterium]|nr:Reeler domain-containing protein [Xanthomonadales bacterium]
SGPTKRPEDPTMRTVLALLLSAPFAAAAFSNGSTDCNVPQHGFSATPGSGGYTLVVPASYLPGETVTVSLTGTTAFKGLLLSGRNGNELPVGSWQFPSGYRGVVDCGGSSTNTLTHSSAATKAPPVAFAWTAPSSATGFVTFRATIMVDFATFFVIEASTQEVFDPVFGNGFE